MSSTTPIANNPASIDTTIDIKAIKNHIITNLVHKSISPNRFFLKLKKAISLFYHPIDDSGHPLIEVLTQKYPCFAFAENSGYIPEELYIRPDIKKDPKSANIFKAFLTVLLGSGSHELELFKGVADAIDVDDLPRTSKAWHAIFDQQSLDVEDYNIGNIVTDFQEIMSMVSTPQLPYGTQNVVYLVAGQPVPVSKMENVLAATDSVITSSVFIPDEFLAQGLESYGIKNDEEEVQFNLASYVEEAAFVAAVEEGTGISAFRANLEVDGKVFTFHLLSGK